MAQCVKDLVLSLLWHGLLLWHRFSPWPRNFCMLQSQPKKKKKKKKRGVPFMAQWLLNTTRIQEDMGSIPGLSVAVDTGKMIPESGFLFTADT